jgi:hypothetical protein
VLGALISGSGRSETLQSDLEVHRCCMPGASAFAIPLEVNLLGSGRFPATWVCWPAFSSSPTTHGVGLARPTPWVSPNVGHVGTHRMPAGGCSPAPVVGSWVCWSGTGGLVLGVSHFWSFSCRGSHLTHVVGLSHRGSPGHARDAGRWMLSGAGGWVLGLLERDRWFGFRCGSFLVFFFFFFFILIYCISSHFNVLQLS